MTIFLLFVPCIPVACGQLRTSDQTLPAMFLHVARSETQINPLIFRLFEVVDAFKQSMLSGFDRLALGGLVPSSTHSSRSMSPFFKVY